LERFVPSVELKAANRSKSERTTVMDKKTKIICVIIALAVVIIAASTGFHLMAPQPEFKPLSCSLSVNPTNHTVVQGGNTTISVEIFYLEGKPKPITLSAKGGPNGTNYEFSNQTGTPTATQPFSSYLTISVAASTASGSYSIDVSSNDSAQTCQAAFNLTVLYAEVQVTGTITIVSQINLSGTILDIIPTDILFESKTTGQTYQAKAHRFTDTSIAPGKTGNYFIQLPNQQSYHVKFYCFSFPHYIPVPHVATEGTENGYFTVDCGAGINSLAANFAG
jgi:hypothetical protein